VTVAFARDRAAHLKFVHRRPGFVPSESNPVDVVPPHPAVDVALGRQTMDPLALVAYLVLFAGTAAFARRRPSFAVAVLIATTPFALYRDVFATTITLGKIALLAALGGLAFRVASEKLDTSGLRAVLPLAVALGTLFVATAISIVQAAHPDAAVRETFKALQYLALTAVVFAAWRIDPDERPIRYALLATMTVVAVVAIAEEFGGAPSVLRAGNDLIPRIAGPLEGPNQLAGFLELALPFATAFALFRKTVPGEALALGLGAVAEVLTLSRSGLAATLLAMTIVIGAAPGASRRRLAAPAIVGIVIATAVFAGSMLPRTHDGGTEVVGRMLSASESAQPGGVGKRSQLWYAAWVLWKAHPLLGIGAGNFEYAVGSIFPGVRTHANNAYLQALAEGGILLFLATAAALLTPLVLFARAARGNPIVLGALASCTAFALHQFADDLMFFPKVGGLYWIIVGLAAGEIVRARAAEGAADAANLRAEGASGQIVGTIQVAVRYLYRTVQAVISETPMLAASSPHRSSAAVSVGGRLGPVARSAQASR
jgi:O-antigen ligase